jgi:CBS domain-containing protein
MTAGAQRRRVCLEKRSGPPRVVIEGGIVSALQPDQGSYLTPTLQHATVADAMHPGILSCPADAPVVEVARLMASHHVHCVAVMGLSDEDHVNDKVVWGIVSDLDLIRVGVRTGADRTAGAMALQPVITVYTDTPLVEAGELMIGHSIGHLVVLNPATQLPIGILSTLDLAGIIAWGQA